MSDFNTQPGKLKIFFGYSSDSCTSSAMLHAARMAADEGIDVVVGCIGKWPDISSLEQRLELIGSSLNSVAELDLDAALLRAPELIVIDELAHTNGVGRHSNRYQDVQELLQAGSDVYASLNVQQLEGLTDIISTITHTAIRERIPDSVFDEADQVVLVDCGANSCDEQITEMRELALKRMERYVHRRLENKTQHGDSGSVAMEHVLLCLSDSPSNEKTIRAAARIAEAFKASFTAVIVKTANIRTLDEASLTRLRKNIALAEQFGAKVKTLYGDDFASQIAEFAKASGVSKIVIGRSAPAMDRFLIRPSLTDRLTDLAPSIEIYAIPNIRQHSKPHVRRLHMPHYLFSDFLKTILILAICTGISFMLSYSEYTDADIIPIYILGVLISTIVTRGKTAGVFASLIAVSLFNYIFTEPYFSLQVDNRSYPLSFIIMFSVSLITGALVTRVKEQERMSAMKAYRTETLLETSQKLQRATSFDETISESAAQLGKLLDRTVLIYPVENGKLGSPRVFPEINQDELEKHYSGDRERATALWVYKNCKCAGTSTDTLSDAKALYMPIYNPRNVFGVAAIFPNEERNPLEIFERNLLAAMLGEIALAFEKDAISKEQKLIALQAQQEHLRANLLRSISHDLRTPITGITGNALILMKNGATMEPEKKQRICNDIYDDAMWLNSSMENLLSITRLDSGEVNIKMQSELLEDVIIEAINHVRRQNKDHIISTISENEFLMVKIDIHLIVQVLVNLIENAVKYTPNGSHINLSIKESGKMALIEVSDDGKGISDEDKANIFGRFYTASNMSGDGRRGLGLGLCLCKAIVTAHGGDICVRDNLPHGTIFGFTLIKEEANSYAKSNNIGS